MAASTSRTAGSRCDSLCSASAVVALDNAQSGECRSRADEQRNKQHLPHLDADIEEEKCHWDFCLRQADFTQYAGKSKAVE